MFWKMIVFSVGLALATGCVTTGDPTQGGLFGWSEDKAKERQTEMKTEVAQEETAIQAAQAERDRLEAEVQSAAKKKTAQKNQLTSLEKDLEALDKEMSADQATSAEQKKRLASLQQRRVDLEKQLQTADPNDEAEIARLKQEIDRLVRESVALSEL